MTKQIIYGDEKIADCMCPAKRLDPMEAKQILGRIGDRNYEKIPDARIIALSQRVKEGGLELDFE